MKSRLSPVNSLNQGFCFSMSPMLLIQTTVDL